MKIRRLTIPSALVLALVSGQALALNGTYTDKNGISTYAFHPGGIVDVTTMGTTMEMKYAVDGNKIRIQVSQGGPKMVLSILPGGAISGPGGVTLTKTNTAPAPSSRIGSAAAIEAPKLPSGLWKISAEMSYQGKHRSLPAHQKCLSTEDLHQLLGIAVMPGSDATPAKMKCTTSNYGENSSTMTWNFVCRGPHKGAGTVSFTHSQNSFTAHLVAKQPGQVEPMKMTTTAERLGDCSP